MENSKNGETSFIVFSWRTHSHMFMGGRNDEGRVCVIKERYNSKWFEWAVFTQPFFHDHQSNTNTPPLSLQFIYTISPSSTQFQYKYLFIWIALLSFRELKLNVFDIPKWKFNHSVFFCSRPRLFLFDGWLLLLLMPF